MINDEFPTYIVVEVLQFYNAIEMEVGINYILYEDDQIYMEGDPGSIRLFTLVNGACYGQ